MLLRPFLAGLAVEVVADGAAVGLHEVELGDVVIFNHYLFHGVYGKQEDRSYIAMKFAAQPTCQDHIASLKHHGQDVSKLHDNWRHSQRPRIQSMVQNLLAWEES